MGKKESQDSGEHEEEYNKVSADIAEKAAASQEASEGNENENENWNWVEY